MIVPATAPPVESDAQPPADESTTAPHRTLRLVATVSGLLGAVLCVLVGFLPVHSTDASFSWPQGQQLASTTSSVTAPLIAQTSQSLDVRIPCSVLADAPPGRSTLILSTMAVSAQDSKASALYVTAGDAVTATFRNSVAASAPRSDLGRCSTLHVWSSPSGPTARSR